MRSSFLKLATSGLVVALALPGAAHAVGFRTWVSVATGVDNGSCGPRLSPCRTLQVAYDHTSAGGEIDIIDSGGIGTLVIDKAITVLNVGGGKAMILATSGGTGITINAGASDTVHLEGLTIEGGGVGYNGIVINSAGSVTIVDSAFRQFYHDASNNVSGNGILAQPTNGSLTLTVLNSIFSNNGLVGLYLIITSPTSNTTAIIDGVTSINNGYGVAFDVVNSTSGTSEIYLSNSTIAKNSGTGLEVFKVGATTLNGYIKGNRILKNGQGYYVLGSAVTSFGGNTFAGNGASSGTLTPGSDQ